MEIDPRRRGMTVQLCAEKVREGDPDRFLSSMTAPPEARAPLFVLYAFNLEIARAPWMSQEPMIGEMRLQFWRDVVDEAVEGGTRAHEVAAPLAELIRSAELPADTLHRMIDARRWDLDRDPFEDAAAFEAHIRDTSAALMDLSAHVLGAPGLQAAQQVGMASGIANWLVAVPALEAVGRLPLVDGRPESVRALAQSALDRLKGVGPVPKSARPALRAGWLARPILKNAVRDPRHVANGTLMPSEFTRRFRLLRKQLLGGF